jgi:hypothetical protein
VCGITGRKSGKPATPSLPLLSKACVNGGLISHCGFGFHTAAPLIALVYLCCSGIRIDLPR